MSSNLLQKCRRELLRTRPRVSFIPAAGAVNHLIESFEQRLLLSAWYVATTGSDSNPGTLKQPFATIQQAANNALPGDFVLIRGGTYHQGVTPVNSGTAVAPITYEPYNNELVTIDGADSISGWTGYQNSIYNAPQPWDLGAGGNQVFVDGKMLNEARFPNSGPNLSLPAWATASSAVVTPSTTGGLPSATYYNSSLTQPAGTLVGAVAHFLPGQQWVDQTGVITANSPGSITLTYIQETSYQVPKAGDRFYIVGAFQTLDSAGEWYRDPTSGQLFVWTPAGDNPAGHVVEAKARQYAFDLSGKSYINVEGFKLFACSVNTDANSTSVLLDHLTVNYVSHSIGLTQFTMDPWSAPNLPSTTGINLNGQFDTLQNSTIMWSSGNGVYVGGSNNTVQNCLVRDCDYEAGDEAAINVQGFNENILSNTVLYCARSGIEIRNTAASLISHNYISGIGIQTTDLGGIYTWGTDGMGTEISYNTINNIHTGGFGGAGVYLDNFCQNYVVDHNLVYDCDMALKMNPPSTNDLIFDNTLVGTKFGLQSSGNQSMVGCVFENNIFGGSIMFGPGSIQSNNLLSGTNPLFVNAAAGNFQLQSTSPAIDTGTVAMPYTAGYVGAAPDIGAYEYGVTPFAAGFTSTPFVSIAVNNPSIVLLGNTNANPGALYDLNLGTVTDAGYTVSQYIVHWGDGSTDTYASGGDVTHTFNNSTAAGLPGVISVDLIDNSGPAGIPFVALGAGTLNLTLNPYPTIPFSGASAAYVSDVYQLSIAPPIDPGFYPRQATVNWGDATSTTYTFTSPANAINGTHTYLATQTTAITVDLTDDSGTYVGPGSLPLNVLLPSTVSLAGASTTNVGDAYTLNLTDANDPSGAISSFIIHWGDGTQSVANVLGGITHVYTAARTPTIVVDTVDQFGVCPAAGSLSLTVIQPAIPPSLSMMGNANANAGGIYALKLSAITDLNSTPSQYVINWGDGTSSTSAALGTVSHVYTAAGSAIITVDVVDAAATWTAAASTAITINSPPTVTLSGNSTVTAGSVYTLNVGAVTNPGYSVSQYTIHWGDGKSSVVSSGGAITRTYDSAASQAISVDLTDSTGTWSNAGAMKVTVLNPQALPSNIDIGAPKVAGSASFANGTYTVTGAGTDIWNSSDQFRYAYANVTGNVSIAARVTSVQYTNKWAKAGVMIRNGTAANAAFADVVVAPGGYIAFQWRAKAGAACSQTVISGKFAPRYVKLTRIGNSFAAYYSNDGVAWTRIGSSQTIAMSASVTTGLAVTSVNPATTCTAKFANVSITPNV